VEGIETKYFEELILYLIEFYSSNGFAYLSLYLSKSEIAVFTRFGRLKIWELGVVVSSRFLQWGVSNIFA